MGKSLKIGTVAPIGPPAEIISRTARRCEEKGYDSIWWADHLMNWWHHSLWDSKIAQLLESPHIFFDTIATIAFVAANTNRIQLGTSVTEPIRRHPVMLAQSFATLDHMSKGRCIFGMGAGEAMNITPYGIDFSKPVSKLEEALKIMRLCWESEIGETINYDGRFWRLKDAIFDFPLYGGKSPPIWVGAHGPKMLDVTARLADGWLPVKMPPNEYEEKLNVIRELAEKAGRNASEITPGLFAPLIIAESKEECLKVMETPIIRSLGLALPPESFERHGLKHPLGEEFYALTDYIPTKISRKEMVNNVKKVPIEVVEERYIYGAPEDVIETLDTYIEKGLEHVDFWNETFLGDPAKVGSSYRMIDEVVKHYR